MNTHIEDTKEQTIESQSAEILQQVDRALSQDDCLRHEELEARNTKEARAHGHVTGLARLMRRAGAALLVTAAAVFLVQGWGEMGHLLRYFSFLGFTAAMCAAGFFCGIRIKEDKGARTFMALCALVIPVHFAQLGALIYSASPFRLGGVHYPAFLTWIAPDLTTALIATAVGIAALLPVALISFLSLARKQAKAVSALYILSSAALLLPFREPDVMAITALGLAAIATYFDIAVLSRDSSMRTPEGALVRGMLALPLVMLIARTLQLYSPTQFFVASIFSILAGVFYYLIPTQTRDSEIKGFFEGLASVPTAIAGIVLTDLVVRQFQIDPQYSLIIGGLPLVGVFSLMALGAESARRFLSGLASTVALGVAVLELGIYPGAMASFICVAIAVLVMIDSYAKGHKGFFVCAVGTFIFGLIHQIRLAMEVYTLSPWISLAVFGILTVIAGSYVERNYKSIIQAARAIGNRFGRLEN